MPIFNNSKFKFWNRVVAWCVFAVALVTYTLTLEPTASFWDCGEFIASSYKLEVGHPPGNPTFQVLARFFSLVVGPSHAAVAINAMSGLCSAFTIFFLYLTIVFFAKRIVLRESDGSFSTSSAIAIMGSGAVGALIYCFSDTFWFSAVEAEVYAMSSLFTALVFWAMTKWYDEADEPHSARWLVLIFFLMGLSVGVHLLNLLTIPALVFMYFYRKREEQPISFWKLLAILAGSAVLVYFLVFLFIPGLPKMAAWFDRIAVNDMGLPYNSGAAAFVAILLVALIVGIFITQKKGKQVLNTVLLSTTMMVIGFSLFAVVIIRSAAGTPTNEYQPDNPYTLVRYLSREQYGSAPIVYGPNYSAVKNRQYTLEKTSYYAPLDGKYIEAEGPSDITYDEGTETLFPRMWSYADDHVNTYIQYVENPIRTYKDIYGQERKEYKQPTMAENLSFFLDYQIDWMYWRYFLWNFAGRQNEIHGRSKNAFFGNWESGIGPLDRFMLGDQSDAPGFLADNKGKNHYFMLPLILGLIGLVFQFGKDKRGSWLIFLMFFMTGIAIVLYLNQNPGQVRERDYAYAGSFYFFAVWTGFAVAALAEWIGSFLSKNTGKNIATAATAVICLGVPALMAAENWDDHDRSNRYTAVEMARNYLNSAGENGLLITHGDNDTFPLWYAQEVESVRPDVRILNTSLLGTDWHINQMRTAINDSEPLQVNIPHRMYLYGTNETVVVNHTLCTPTKRGGYRYGYFWPDENGKARDVVPLKDVIEEFAADTSHLAIAYYDEDDRPVVEETKCLTAYRVSIPVNKENVFKYGILRREFVEENNLEVLDSLVFELPYYVDKPNLFLLDYLSTYEWDRPISVLAEGGGIFTFNLDDYLMFDGFSWRLVPLKTNNHTARQIFDTDAVYDKIMGKDKYPFTWDALSRGDYFADYQNYYTFLAVINQRNIFAETATALLAEDKKEKALEVLDKCMASVPEGVFPIETVGLSGMYSNDLCIIDISDLYGLAGREDTARELMDRFISEFVVDARFFLKRDMLVDDRTCMLISYVLDNALGKIVARDVDGARISPWYTQEQAKPLVDVLMDYLPIITATYTDSKGKPQIMGIVSLLLDSDNGEFISAGSDILDFMVEQKLIDQDYADDVLTYFALQYPTEEEMLEQLSKETE